MCLVIYVASYLLDIRAELDGCVGRDQYRDHVSQRHFITSQDLCDITRRIRNFAHHWNSEDATSVDRSACELLLEVPSRSRDALCHKIQGMLNINVCKKSLSCFVLMTEFQAQLFENFVNKLVYIDSTHTLMSISSNCHTISC